MFFFKVERENGSECLKRDFGRRVLFTSRAVLCSTAGDEEKEGQSIPQPRSPFFE
jgi:hypothetical protein